MASEESNNSQCQPQGSRKKRFLASAPEPTAIPPMVVSQHLDHNKAEVRCAALEVISRIAQPGSKQAVDA
eukprot:1196278-Alexandrium_andersonii.AAC.1